MKASISPVLWVFLLSALLVAAPARGQDSSAENPPGDAVGTALNTFAFALYRQLASENEGENLFFSPYSVYNALLMATEGARGETALQMGTVLKLPDAVRRRGDDAVDRPWDTSG